MFSILSVIDQPIDYIGQSCASKLMNMIFIIGYVVAFIVGVVMSNLKYTMAIGVLTCLLAFVITIPPWPYFRRNHLQFKEPVKVKMD